MGTALRSPVPGTMAEDGGAEITLMALPPVFTDITEIANAGDGSGRLFVVEKRGTVQIIEPSGQLAPGVFLDVQSRSRNDGEEQGLLGLAFSPSYETDRALYVNYTDNNGDTVVSRFTASNPNDADEASEAIVLQVDQPAGNHNGGKVAFGPDGMLYIAMGDGGGHGDPGNRAQDNSELLGKMLRFDPATGTTEIVAKGLRNPWKFSFDSVTGDVFIADVGQGRWEEVNFVPAGELQGKNFGWRLMEGNHCYLPVDCSAAGLELPVHEYSHDDGCSVTGGYVSRQQGSLLAGIYVHSDFCSGTIWGLHRDAEGRWENSAIGDALGNVTTFGEGEDGALYIAIDRGEWRVYRIAAALELPELPFTRRLPLLAADGR